MAHGGCTPHRQVLIVRAAYAIDGVPGEYHAMSVEVELCERFGDLAHLPTWVLAKGRGVHFKMNRQINRARCS